MSKREKKLLLIGILIIALTVSIRFYILPTYDKYIETKEELKASEHQLQHNQLQLQSAERYINYLESLERELEAKEKFFYHGNMEKSRLQIIRYIDGLIDTMGLKITSKELSSNEFDMEDISSNNNLQSGLSNVNNNDSVEEFKIRRFNNRLNLEGSTEELLAFFESINQYDKFYQIRQMEIKRNYEQDKLAAFILIESYAIK